MLKECLEVFKDRMNATQGRLILDTYIPADGTYLIVDSQGNILVNTDIVKDKKTKKDRQVGPGFSTDMFL